MVALDPWAHDTVGARALAAVHDEFVGAINDELDTHLRVHPIFGPMAAALSPEAIAKQRADARVRIGKAFAGQWDEYVIAMRGQGRAFALLGVGYSDWQMLIGAWMVIMQIADMFFIVRPTIYRDGGVHFNFLLDVLGTLAPICIFLGFCVRKVCSAPLVPINDPRMHEALSHKNYV